MSRADDLSKIERSIKEAETRIKTVQNSLDALDRDISNVSALEKTLQDNVKCLKKQKIIAIAQEFKKAKDELKRTQSKLMVLRNDREHFRKAQKDVEAFMKQAQKDFEKLQNESENNVLSFNFGNKNDG